MGRFLIFVLFLLGAFSCIKKKYEGPVPKIEFLEFKKIGPAGYDSAMFKLGYVDSDGDLFCDRSDQKPNLILTTWAYKADSAKYVLDLVISRVILQPADGYYKDKPIEGYIFLHEAEFRSDNKPKEFRFEVYMTDNDGNKSETVVSDKFTLSN